MQFLKFNKYNTKRVTLIFILFIPLLLTSSKTAAQKRYKVVLDAGHGGKDPGNLGNGYQEKKIVLKVAMLVGKELEKTKDIDVVYTRKKDVFIELHNRAKKANKEKADLFVSIHCDAFQRPDPHGAGTFVLGLRGNQGNFEIAKRENAVILLEDDYKQNYDYDPNSPESLIGLSVLQEENLDESLSLAGMIQGNFVTIKRYNRNVKQDNFLVLRETVMPSVLIELGFLTNKAEGKFLNSKQGQERMALAIAKAIIGYVNQLKLNTVQEIVVTERGVTTQTAQKNTANTNGSSTTTPKEEKNTQAKPEPIVVKKEEPKIVVEVKQPEKVEEKITKEESKKENQTKPTSVLSEEKVVVKKDPVKIESPIQFKVQIAASKTFLATEPYNFKGLQNVEVMQIDEYYKYYYGKSSNYESIKQVLEDVKSAGHKGAFIVAFENGVKIPLYKALKKL
ncbi:N-acetylmuramoyl-L-alanine amidase [Tenacibaculum sp. IB213877]|uniref:N-acetylmuramoyl-L-alanine amidase family protein n=1 Tax=Tenacibaculum sp. IB213877 TaxID=3097351 RepID=UPI002A5AC4DF|nr:N-acetylmuramoyl-L-alanine amidase [Tenacibaculum sp. IB213877]MDY0780013.1 N-acetylmuramoyl-L-alanine amidase [Tenacibaculum sp. IB213877]